MFQGHDDLVNCSGPNKARVEGGAQCNNQCERKQETATTRDQLTPSRPVVHTVPTCLQGLVAPGGRACCPPAGGFHGVSAVFKDWGVSNSDPGSSFSSQKGAWSTLSPYFCAGGSSGTGAGLHAAKLDFSLLSSLGHCSHLLSSRHSR